MGCDRRLSRALQHRVSHRLSSSGVKAGRVIAIGSGPLVVVDIAPRTEPGALVHQRLGERVKMTAFPVAALAGRTGRPRAPDVVIGLGPVDNHARHLRSPGRLEAILISLTR